MITRKTLGLLALTSVALFALSALTRNQHHGAGGAIGFLFWWGFLVSFLVLVVTSIVTLTRRQPRRSRPLT